jgi:hypothetical protein
MVLAGGRIEGVNGDMWVHQSWLGVNGGGRGGRQSEAAGGDCYFLGWAMFLGSKVRR